MDGKQIRSAREARKMTQAELAAVVGVGWRTISNWENGHSVPRNRSGLLEQFFNADAPAESEDPIRSASDVTLLAELLRRAEQRRATAV